MSSRPLTPSDYSALATIAKARRENMANMFSATELSFSKYSIAKIGKNLVTDGYKLGKSADKLYKGIKTGGTTVSALSQTGQIQSNSQELISIASGMDFSAVKEIITSDVTHQLIGELTPFVSVLNSSYKSVKSWRAVVKNAADLYKGDYYLEGVLPGDPTAAAQAVLVCIKRLLAANTADAVRNTASASTKIAGLFADFGTVTTVAIGTATLAAKLIQELAILGRDYRDMKAGNKRLAEPDTLDVTVFKESPILGCYLIACSDTSMVANFMVADIGLPGWMDKVEKLKKGQLDPLINNASKAITTSHISLDGLKSNKGTFNQKPGFLDRKIANMKYQFNQLISSNAKNKLNT